MMPRERRGPYKRYLRDPNVPIPRSTLWNRIRQEQVQADQIDVNLIPDNVGHREDIYDSDRTPSDQDSFITDDFSEVEVEMEDRISETSDLLEDHFGSSEPSDISDNEAASIHYEEDAGSEIDDYMSDESHSEREGSPNFEEPIFEVDNDFNDEQYVVPLYYEDNFDNGGEAGAHQENEHFIYEVGGGRPLYEGAQISSEESDLLIMSFIIRWGLDDKGIEHLLRLIDCHMLLGSKYTFLKKFPTDPSMKMRYFCRDCSLLMPPANDDKVVVCSCGFEISINDIKLDGNYFVQLSTSEQIQKIMSNSSLVRQLRKESRENDVTSGKVYRRLKERGVIGDDDISLQWNTDGVKPFKSSKVTVYPIQACINELPVRVRRDNMLLCGLYYGKSKPDINVILKPFVDELCTLHRDGVNCDIPGRGRVNVKVHTFLCPVDSVARPMLQGIMQFNGQYGCSFCLRKGIVVERGRGRARIYSGGAIADLRTEKQHLEALAALQRWNEVERFNEPNSKPKAHVQGVKKTSVLLLLPLFNIVKSFVPDYMHCALEGVVVTFYRHWCDSSYEKRQWYLTKQARDRLSSRLKAIRTPVEITRPPRSIDEIKLWKASELKSFLLYYSLICLRGLLPGRYLRHWLLFVYSMTIFLKEQITSTEHNKARQAIKKFVDDIAKLYPGVHSLYTFNTHLLLHVAKAIEDFGGLWSSSTFPFEDFNGVITGLIRGTQSVPLQVCRSFLRLRHMSHTSNGVFTRNNCSDVGKNLYQSMTFNSCHSHVSHAYSRDIRLFGAPESHTLSLVEKVAVEHLLGHRVEAIARSYRRMILRGQVFHSSVYAALSVRDNSIAKMRCGMSVSIYRVLIVRIVDSIEVCCVALCRLLENFQDEFCKDRELDISSRHIVQTCSTDRVVSVLPSDIKDKCVSIPYDDGLCIVPLVNVLEGD